MCSSVPPTDCIRPLYDVFQCSTYRLYQTTVWCVPPTDYQTTLYDVFHLLTVSDQTVWCVPVFHLQTIRPHCMMCSSVPPTNCIRSNWMMCSSVPPTDYQTTLYDVFQLLTPWFQLNTSTVLVQVILKATRSLDITQSLADGNLLNKIACCLRKRLASCLSTSIRHHIQGKRNFNLQPFITQMMFYLYSKCECWMKHVATHRNKRQVILQVHLLKFLM